MAVDNGKRHNGLPFVSCDGDSWRVESAPCASQQPNDSLSSRDELSASSSSSSDSQSLPMRKRFNRFWQNARKLQSKQLVCMRFLIHAPCSHGGAYPAAQPAARNLGKIILEQRQCSGTYTHVFLMYCVPPHAFFPLFLLLFLPFWASSPHKWCTCCPSPIWNGPCMNFASSLLWALLRRQGLGSTGGCGCQLGPDPKGGWGGTPPLQTPKWFYGTMGFVGLGGNLLN